MKGGGGPPPAPLALRFWQHVRERELLPPGARVVAACSGGVDSTVLLHLLRFPPRGEGIDGVSLVVAHVDHGMRPGSVGDRQWTRGLVRGWGLPMEEAALEPPPATEAQARAGRYQALEAIRQSTESDLVLTAHHADDQAETVLFRALRGAGPRGLRGILERRSPALVRPLLPFFRRELEEYAAAVGLVFRHDLSNRDPRWTRNRIRHELLPLAEELVPGGRASLARLAGVMAERAEVWDALLQNALEELPITRSAGRIEVARTPFLTYHSAVRTGLLELWLRELGGALGEASIRVALQAASSSPSGRTVSLPGGILLLREFDLLVLTRSPRPPEDEPLGISSADQGCGVARIGGSRVSIRWGSRAPDARCVERFVTSGLRFPLLVRGRRPGDRIRLGGGTRKLKKVLADHRIPLGKRDRQPLLVDAAGLVLWVPGVVRSADAAGEDAGFFVGVGDADRT